MNLNPNLFRTGRVVQPRVPSSTELDDPMMTECQPVFQELEQEQAQHDQQCRPYEQQFKKTAGL